MKCMSMSEYLLGESVAHGKRSGKVSQAILSASKDEFEDSVEHWGTDCRQESQLVTLRDLVFLSKKDGLCHWKEDATHSPTVYFAFSDPVLYSITFGPDGPSYITEYAKFKPDGYLILSGPNSRIWYTKKDNLDKFCDKLFEIMNRIGMV